MALLVGHWSGNVELQKMEWKICSKMLAMNSVYVENCSDFSVIS